MLNVKNEQLKNYSRIFKDAGKYPRTTRCFSRIKDITSFDNKFKDSSWRSRTSGNLIYTPCIFRDAGRAVGKQSCRHGGAIVGLAPPNKASTPQIEL